MNRLAYLIALAWSLFQLYTASIGVLPATLTRPTHVTFALMVVFAVAMGKGRAAKKPASEPGGVPTTPESRPTSGNEEALSTARSEALAEATVTEEDDPKSPRPSRLSAAISGVFCAAAAACLAYVWIAQDYLTQRIWFVSPVTTIDTIYGLVLVFLVLEATRRVVGWGLVTVVAIFIAYQWFGPYLGGLFVHRGISLGHFVDQQALSLQGIIGIPTSVSVNYVFYFILFGAFLDVSGGGRLFIDGAVRLTAGFRGGAAKAAVVASALMGSINGSAVANVVSTGIFTIPLMKKAGYRPQFAAAVEAAASTGGQILPPIMGAGAFILAEFLGLQYRNVIVAATIPALAYFGSILLTVHLRALRRGLGINSGKLLQDAFLPRAHLLLPVIILVYLILSGSSLTRAAFISIIAVVLAGLLRKATRLSVGNILDALAQGARASVVVAIPCAAAGMVVGVVAYSGLGLKLSSIIISLAGGDLLRALLLVMAGSIIMGMGMPTSSAYIMGAILMAPALIELGVAPIAAHLFVFYFACLSMITPPVALASYAAAGIADTSNTKTSFIAMGIAGAAFLVPFAFAYKPALLMQGGVLEVVSASIFLLLGVVALSGSVAGYLAFHNRRWESVVLFLSAVLIIAPEMTTSLIGVALFALVLVLQILRAKRPAEQVAPS